jgi:NAD-dependent DNA ligase
MSDVDGWDWIYANKKTEKEKLSQVCFTGFNAAEKAELEQLAAQAHLAVVTSVTRDLAFLCAGANAGAVKLTKASGQGVVVLSRQQFEHLLETGELEPSSLAGFEEAVSQGVSALTSGVAQE